MRLMRAGWSQAGAAFGSGGRAPNDDRVLFCCLARRERLADTDAVALLSRDNNLRAKAASCHVAAVEPHKLPNSRAGMLRMCRDSGAPAAPPPPPAPEVGSARDAGPAAGAVPGAPAQSPLPRAEPGLPGPHSLPSVRSGEALPSGATPGPRLSDAQLGRRPAPAADLQPDAERRHGDGAGGASSDGWARAAAGGAEGGAAAPGPALARIPSGGGGSAAGLPPGPFRSMASGDSSGFARSGSGHSDGGGDAWGNLAREALDVLEGGLSQAALFFFQKQHGCVWTEVRGSTCDCACTLVQPAMLAAALTARPSWTVDCRIAYMPEPRPKA